jgi:hypothetical protein
VFGWTRTQVKRPPHVNGGAAELIGVIDAAVPPYVERIDRGGLVYPACKRKSVDLESDIRSIWAHSRLEAIRYLTLVPGRRVELLIEPSLQLEMFDAFLRKQPHADTMVDFTGVATDDLVVAIIAGLNWLNHCALLAGADRTKFSSTQRNFRRLVTLGQQWWSLEGAQVRCAEMMRTRDNPPLMLYLAWQSYTLLSKEIASAATFGPSVARTIDVRRGMLEQEFAGRPIERQAALAELENTMERFGIAREPDDLLG